MQVLPVIKKGTFQEQVRNIKCQLSQPLKKEENRNIIGR